MENIEKNGILDKDEHRADIYSKVKEYCNAYHRRFIDKVLDKINLSNLNDYYELYTIEKKTNKDKECIKNLQQEFREYISNHFKNDEEYKGLFGKEMFKNYLQVLYQDDKEKIADIGEFNRFITYFSGYNLNRENMYVADEKKTAIAYRLINENLATFIDNIKPFNEFIKKQEDKLEILYKELEEYLQVNNISEMFEIDYYNEVLTQKGIEIYNLIISGRSDENKKIKGLNEYVNEYNQITQDKKLPKFKELYKQILSDKIGASFKFEIIENDKNLIQYIDEYYEIFSSKIFDNNRIIDLLNSIEQYDLDKIYLNADLSLTEVSQNVFDNWNYIQEKLNERYDSEYIGKEKIGSEKYLETRKKYFKNNKCYSIKYIDSISNGEDRIVKYVKELISIDLVEEIKNNYSKYVEIKTKYIQDLKEIIKNEKDIEIIKNLLDSMKKVQELLKMLIPKDRTLAKDEKFYGEYFEIYENILEIIPLYNKTRNYITQKPYSTKKIKINFESPTLLNGWDSNKEKDYLGILLKKHDKYYLGILNTSKKVEFIFDNPEADYYEKVDYKLFKDVSKMVPKCSIALNEVKNHFENSDEDYILNNNSFIMPLKISKYIFDLSKTEDGKIKKYQIEYYRQTNDEKGYKEALHDWIEFCINFIKSYKSTANIDISSINLNNYNDLVSFYNDLDELMYSISFSRISDDLINKMINDEELYLFQIYSKDFSETKKAKGKENLHTLYWKALFDERNLNDIVYKLDGNAEIFYRKASLKLENVACHKANQPINNKNTGNPKKSSLFPYDLIKDKRYTQDKFQFHVPITMNFKNQKLNNINSLVNKYLKYNDDIHVIGIDRGERNLIYLTLIDSKGRIIIQKSLNEIVNEYNSNEYRTDYHNLLDNREKEREEARESWKTIENIKELKEGYISQVVHVIVELMKEYNAIIVLEDLNSGFKNSRIKVEKQVYQKFEKMLIDKLNYLVFKENDWEAEGGILNAYQLTNKFESFTKLGKQSGVLFYIPAWCTSKLDPTTGFINLLYLKYENFEKSTDFVRKLDDIRYNNKENLFEFDIDYSKLTDRIYESKEKWTLYSYGERIKSYRNKENKWDNLRINLTEEFKNLFNKYNIDFDSIKESILNNADSKFFNAKYNEDGFDGFIELFKLMCQMRNSIINGQEDYLISPIKNKSGRFFDSREGKEFLPKDADSNGAYNIARKGLMLIEQIKTTEDDKLGKIKYNISNKEWLQFAQNEDNL